MSGAVSAPTTPDVAGGDPHGYRRESKVDQWICWWSIVIFYNLFGLIFVALTRVMPPPRLIPRLVFVPIVLTTLNQVIQLYGLKYITAGLAAVISSALTPIALLVFSVTAGQERFSPRQLSAMAVGGIDEMFAHVERKAPLQRNIDADEVGKTAVYLLSDLSSGVTGENIYVDGGFSTVGL